MQGSDQAVPGPSSRLGQMVQLVVKALLARSPAYVWRVLRVAFSPSLILRKLALVSLLQLLAYALNPADACAPGPPLPYVRATRTSLPRWVRTGGAGGLTPGPCGRTARTRAPCHPRRSSCCCGRSGRTR